MSLTYDELRARIGFKAGYAPNLSISDFVGNQEDIVEEILRRGLRRWADPPMLPGEHFKHQWSFLTQTVTYNILADTSTLSLPANFVEFKSPLVYAPGSSSLYPPIELVGAELVMKRLAESDGNGRPRWGGVRALNTEGIGTAWEIVFWPPSDAAYAVKALTKVDPSIPGSAAAQVIGDQPHEATILEACLAETVAMLDDLDNNVNHEARFAEFMAASIAHDRQVTAPQKLPKMIDHGMFDWRKWTIEAWCSEPLMEYVGASSALV